MLSRPKPVVLCILDGWGHREERGHNAIAAAHTPNWDRFWQEYPHGVIHASEGEVGLPCGQMGNSEVGHMNIGAGRVVMQDLPRIDAAIADGSLAKNDQLQSFIAKLKASGGDCHLMGLLSDGGVHAHHHHIQALAMAVAKAGIRVWVHVFLDGRDTPPRSAAEYVSAFETTVKDEPLIRIATVCGRYYAMDRDKRWDRVGRAYDMLMGQSGTKAATASDAIAAAYAGEVSDEFVLPCIIGDWAGMHDGDGLLMANFRADRARQLLTALLDDRFDSFALSRRITWAASLGMVEYSEALNPFIPAMFPPESLTHLLGEVVADAGLKQLRIAETEKYAHVTFFFSGGREEPFAGEERILVPSPDVATYDLKPEMSAYEVTEKLEKAIAEERYDLIIVNYANTDMVGHSGDMNAAMMAVEAVDRCIGRLEAALRAKGGVMLITADHGNAEHMHSDETGQPHTAHTLNLVPVVLVGETFKNRQIAVPEGRLADIAPTLLRLLHLSQPAQMTGRSLLPAEAYA